MNNLRIVRDLVQNVSATLPVTAATWDASTTSIIFSLGPTSSQPIIELRRLKLDASIDHDDTSSELIAAWDAPCPLPDLACDEVLSIHYFPEQERTVLVLAGGDIFGVRHSTLAVDDRIQIVGSVDSQVTAAAWSPDESILVLATASATLLFLTVDFDELATVHFRNEDSKLSKHVSVGWGKAETQFKGKRAHALQDPTMPERDELGTLSPFDCKQTTISWRGDGAYVAVNTILEAGPRRMIRIFTRDGVLDSVTEPVDGLDGALSWRPEGNLLAGIQRLEGDINVVFFERNGLRHGKFNLRIPPGEENSLRSAIELSWNADSSALAVTYSGKVQIWMMSNYHYYLKQEFQFQTRGLAEKALSISWDLEAPFSFAVFSSSSHPAREEDDVVAACPFRSQLRSIKLLPCIDGGAPMPPHDHGIVAVIDGKTIKITPLRDTNNPPPMALHEVSFEHCIKDVAINKTGTRIAVLHDEAISVIHWTAKEPFATPIIADTIPIKQGPACALLQLTYLAKSQLVILSRNAETIEIRVVKNVNSIPIQHAFGRSLPIFIVPSIDREHLCVSTQRDVSILSTKEEDAHSKVVQIASGTAEISRAEVLSSGDKLIAFTLGVAGQLYANNRLLATQCTSFLLTASHLIFTTSNHLLKFAHMADVDEFEIPTDKPEIDERCRAVERGARLVSVMPSAHALTLQLPRGNLETIYPRALVLASIRRNIELDRYGKAFLTCRSQRVDMNILYDHDPYRFMASVPLIIEQLQSVEYIDLLLSQLKDKDVSQTEYLDTLPHRNAKSIGAAKQAPIPTASPKPGSKVNRICEAFLEELESKPKTNSQNIITANVSMIPPNIESGLNIVSTLRQKDEEQADKALEHMCFLVDVNQIYERALAMYDLDLTLLVAQKSQKDPREYLPYLQTLKDSEELRRKFLIDDNSKRYKKALLHLDALGAQNEVMAYIRKHELYKEALELYDYQPESWRKVLRIYADFLVSQDQYREAAIAYESLGDLTSALPAYKAATLWRQALSVAKSLNLDAAEFSTMAGELIDTLVETKEFSAAATIASDYLDDMPAAVRYLCKGFLPNEAIRLATARNRPDLLHSTIEDGIRESVATLNELTAECRKQVIAQTARLDEIRKLKEADPLHFLTGEQSEPHANGEFADDISLAPTQSSLNPSLFTRYGGGVSPSVLGSGTLATNTSRRTSKNRRREERKRARGKKGTVYEEEYLVNSLERLVLRLNDSHDDVREVTEACMRRGLASLARSVRLGVDAVVELLQEKMDEIFGPSPIDAVAATTDVVAAGDLNNTIENGSGPDSTLARPAGAQGVLWDSVVEGRAKRPAPVLKDFSAIALPF